MQYNETIKCTVYEPVNALRPPDGGWDI